MWYVYIIFRGYTYHFFLYIFFNLFLLKMKFFVYTFLLKKVVVRIKYIFSNRLFISSFNRVFEKAFFQVGIIGVLSSMLVYFVIFAENGFMPTRIIAIDSTQWNSPAINDLVDSFNQEWVCNSYFLMYN